MNWDVASWWMHYKLGMPKDLEMLRMECFPKSSKAIYLEYEGAETVPVFASGPRKGQKNYKKATGKHVAQILVSDVDMIVATFEGVTGKCHYCNGTCKELASVSREGAQWRTCSKCGGTGKPAKETLTCAT